jgi:hypothetical protein
MEARKNDTGKLKYSLISPEFIESLTRVMQYGAEKYAENNWVGLEKKRIFDALMRHVMEYWKGNEIDADSGLPHLSHIAANAMMLSQKKGINEHI